MLGAIVSVNSIYGPTALAEVLLIKPPLHSGNQGSNHLEVEQALLLRQMTTAEATVTVARAGTVPYFSDLQYRFAGEDRRAHRAWTGAALRGRTPPVHRVQARSYEI
jgi:hypothetical protein